MKTIRLWSEKKLELLKRYATVFHDIITYAKCFDKMFYIDGFAGAGEHLREADNSILPGSPEIALELSGFTDFIFVEKDRKTIEELRNTVITKYAKIKDKFWFFYSL